MQDSVRRDQRIEKEAFTGQVVTGISFRNCDFSGADLTESQFVNCSFYDPEAQKGCNFSRALLKDASFRQCDLTMCNFSFAKALGLEIAECRAQGADFSSASFLNQITSRTWFCSAFIKKSNLSYANFSKVVLEKCELWENRWMGTNVQGASFAGSDLSGGEFAAFDWRSADFKGCNLSNSELGDLDLRSVNLDGVTIDTLQTALLLQRMNITVVPA